MAHDTAKEQRGFESEVSQLLDLVINSLYSNREIFLRELISNAADAADKLRFLALQDHDLYEGQPDIEISVDFSESLGTVTVRDNGVGMSRDEAVSNLGTIAKSGTKEFFGALSGDAKKDSQLIGQFGVGFYAAFIVAERVVVTSRKAGLGPDEGVRWESDGLGQYSVETVQRKKRGTEIVLHLKDDAKEFANAYRLREICKRYSDHISVPIKMPKVGDEKGDEVVNQAQALWLRPKSEISEEEYKAFYKHVAHDFSDPLVWAHNKVEGKNEYTSLFFVPSRAPFDLWDREAKHGVKLFVQRVFIMDDAETLMPRYLRFVKGIVDTNDLPLNVSREILQRDRSLDAIRNASIKRVLTLIEGIAKGENYAEFWSAFGRVLKEGVIEDSANQERIARLLRFSTTGDVEEKNQTSLEQYVARMGEQQDAIFYMTGENLGTMRNSPHLEYFKRENIEVLLMDDPVDEWVVSHLTEFDGKPLKSAVGADLDSKGDAEENADPQDIETEKSADSPVVKRIKDALGERIEDARPSRRLTTSPACLVSADEQMSANMERLLRAAGQDVPDSKRILEINLEHPMLQMLAAIDDENRFSSWSALLFEQSILAEGGRLDDPAGFVKRMNDVVMELAGASS